MSLPKIERIYTVDEYLALEREAETRHEFIDGIIYAMAGESPAHSIINSNLIREVGTQLLGTPCITYSPNMKVRAGEGGLFAYPDVTIVCGEPRFYDKREDVLVNPIVIFEVLSQSTQGYDRGQKFFKYRLHNETLLDYVLVEQSKPFIDHYRKLPDGEWAVKTIDGLDKFLEISSIDCRIKTSGIYDRIVFPPASLTILD